MDLLNIAADTKNQADAAFEKYFNPGAEFNINDPAWDLATYYPKGFTPASSDVYVARAKERLRNAKCSEEDPEYQGCTRADLAFLLGEDAFITAFADYLRDRHKSSFGAAINDRLVEESRLPAPDSSQDAPPRSRLLEGGVASQYSRNNALLHRNEVNAKYEVLDDYMSQITRQGRVPGIGGHTPIPFTQFRDIRAAWVNAQAANHNYMLLRQQARTLAAEAASAEAAKERGRKRPKSARKVSGGGKFTRRRRRKRIKRRRRTRHRRRRKTRRRKR